ncbi:hypothetical protein MtrunA17_Chr4g0047851 [Medicago truncatula]|uniref:Uncharacterized protein n=1 Tax=Medicago truncatula TaxID=3880 RepID=A0A396IA35_MEDTR|nr:hypothetical protein MtrunA17_Chr4g0047851 [Medicago truncatula]
MNERKMMTILYFNFFFRNDYGSGSNFFIRNDCVDEDEDEEEDGRRR